MGLIFWRWDQSVAEGKLVTVNILTRANEDPSTV
jgi:hypothetical protein